MKWKKINESKTTETRKLAKILNNYGFEPSSRKGLYTKVLESGVRAEISIWSDIPKARGTIFMGSSNKSILFIDAPISDIEELADQISDTLGTFDEIQDTMDSRTQYLTRLSKKRKWLFRTMF